MLPTHDVPCPRCGKALYSSTSLDDGVNAMIPETPKIEHVADGDYLRCPSCGARIAMERMESGGRTAWRARDAR